MGYAGKVEERERARELRAQSWTLQEIADELGVSKGSVSVWVRDVDFEPRPRNRGHSGHKPHPLTLKKQAQLEQCRQEAEVFCEGLTDRDLFIYGVALYVGEGAKTENSGLRMANTSAPIMAAFMTWLRRFFDIDELRLYARLYLHEGLDEDEAISFWSEIVGVPRSQFQSTYRATPRGTHKRSKHVHGCLSVGYNDVFILRRVLALGSAVSSAFADPG